MRLSFGNYGRPSPSWNSSNSRLVLVLGISVDQYIFQTVLWQELCHRPRQHGFPCTWLSDHYHVSSLLSCLPYHNGCCLLADYLIDEILRDRNFTGRGYFQFGNPLFNWDLTYWILILSNPECGTFLPRIEMAIVVGLCGRIDGFLTSHGQSSDYAERKPFLKVR